MTSNCPAWLSDFADWTIQTARYPGAGSGSLAELHYLVLGLCGEVGECLNARKKMLRDGASTETLSRELADVLWYACRLSRAFSVPLLVAEPGSRDLDTLLLQLYRAASRIAELGRWAISTCQIPVEWDGLAEVVGLTVGSLSVLGVDPRLLLQEQKRCLLSRYAPVPRRFPAT